MWTTISSYFWGDEDEQIVPGCAVVDDTQSDDDWILVDVRESEVHGKCFCFDGILTQTCRNVLQSEVVTFLNFYLND